MVEFYPFTDPQLLPDNINEIPMAEEYAYDMDTAQFKYRNGKMYKVYENEALKIKLWKLFMTEKFKWVVFPWVYGHELETLIGKSYTQGYINSEATRYVKEAIFDNLGDYITDLDNMQIKFDDGLLTISFKAITIYGEVEVNIPARR